LLRPNLGWFLAFLASILRSFSQKK
jgi:hypothetical protein